MCDCNASIGRHLRLQTWRQRWRVGTDRTWTLHEHGRFCSSACDRRQVGLVPRGPLRRFPLFHATFPSSRTDRKAQLARRSFDGRVHRRPFGSVVSCRPAVWIHLFLWTAKTGHLYGLFSFLVGSSVASWGMDKDDRQAAHFARDVAAAGGLRRAFHPSGRAQEGHRRPGGANEVEQTHRRQIEGLPWAGQGNHRTWIGKR